MVAEAVPYLQKAQKINAASYSNGFDLTLAYMVSGRLSDARNSAKALLNVKETGEAHNLLAQIEEKDGNIIAAANEFQAAAKLEPSESNLFDWGGELLVHRTLDPAVQVFEEGTRRFPNSDRKSTRLNSSHLVISYAVFCLKKKNTNPQAVPPAPALIGAARQDQSKHPESDHRPTVAQLSTALAQTRITLPATTE